MHKLTFYPLGNADSCLLELEQGKKLLFDFANVRNPDDENDRRIDLAAELRSTLEAAQRDYFDVVAFTHADDDHIRGATEFFFLEHAAMYQGEGRIKIRDLWVPAAIILEEGAEDEARILRTEARHRLLNGARIRVFGRPEALSAWLQDRGLSLESRRHLISNAGTLVPSFSKVSDGIEFFVHSPFSKHCEGGDVDRNTASLVLHGTFDTETKVLLAADTVYDVWQDIVNITKFHNNQIRLAWDIYKLAHHCSYLSLGPEKGKEKTEPVEEVKWLLEQAQPRAIIVITSDPIPSEDTIQPPHRQAHKTYQDCVEKVGGEIAVTMEHPSREKPDKLVIEVDRGGARIVKRWSSPAVVITSRPAPRAG